MVKKVVYAYYAHKSNIDELMQYVKNEDRNLFFALVQRYIDIPNSLFDIIKYDGKTHNISLIKCPTWNFLWEPVVGDSYCFRNLNNYKVIKGGSKVYHNKWMFVADDYTGFDVQASKRRTEMLENTIENYDKMKSRIGNISVWYSLLEQYGIGR